MTVTGALRFAGSSGQSVKTFRASGSLMVVVEPTMLNSPASGAGMPPNASHGLPDCRLCRLAVAASAVGGVLPLPPSRSAIPERPLAPGLPAKSQVAYAVVIEAPSEWPPRTTFPPRLRATLTTRRMSSTATRMPHDRAKGTLASGTAWWRGLTDASEMEPR